MTLYIKNTLEAVEFYSKAFGLSIGYSEKHPDGTYMHAELQKDGVFKFAVSEHDNTELVSAMHEFARKRIYPTTNCGFKFDSEDNLRAAYDMLAAEGVVCRPLEPLPWSPLSADVLDKYGVYWYIHM
ncbi:MAG: VOC family protein [Oscillospiraceae bacterium]|nr:VOC family protein [Oscillospiraceae bacterium]